MLVVALVPWVAAQVVETVVALVAASAAELVAEWVADLVAVQLYSAWSLFDNQNISMCIYKCGFAVQ